MTTEHLIDDLKRDEGCRLRAYQDTVGVWTIGYGHAYVQPGTVWTQEQADQMLQQDLDKILLSLDRNLRWWRTLDHVRQDALANMAFNLGITRLMGFRNSLRFLREGAYERAANNMSQSLWARQVHGRADRIIHMIRTGTRP